MLLFHLSFRFSFFFNDTPTTEIYTLSLHDALPISLRATVYGTPPQDIAPLPQTVPLKEIKDRKSTRLNSSHDQISYAVFCLQQKKHNHNHPFPQQHQPSRLKHHPAAIKQ